MDKSVIDERAFFSVYYFIQLTIQKYVLMLELNDSDNDIKCLCTIYIFILTEYNLILITDELSGQYNMILIFNVLLYSVQDV